MTRGLNFLDSTFTGLRYIGKGGSLLAIAGYMGLCLRPEDHVESSGIAGISPEQVFTTGVVGIGLGAVGFIGGIALSSHARHTSEE